MMNFKWTKKYYDTWIDVFEMSLLGQKWRLKQTKQKWFFKCFLKKQWVIIYDRKQNWETRKQFKQSCKQPDWHFSFLKAAAGQWVHMNLWESRERSTWKWSFLWELQENTRSKKRFSIAVCLKLTHSTQIHKSKMCPYQEVKLVLTILKMLKDG
jgi:hypothetical protein